MPKLSVMVLAAAAACTASASLAQQADAPLPTSAGAGFVDENAKAPPPGPVKTAPAPRTLYKGPLDRLADVPRSNFLSNLHGSVGVMVGSHNTRAAYADVHGPIGDNAAFDLRFATSHSDAPYYGYGDPYSGGPYGYGGPYGSGGRYGYGYGSRFGPGITVGGGAYSGAPYRSGGTAYSLGASYSVGTGEDRYDRVWPNYVPPGGETTTEVTDEPEPSGR